MRLTVALTLLLLAAPTLAAGPPGHPRSGSHRHDEDARAALASAAARLPQVTVAYAPALPQATLTSLAAAAEPAPAAVAPQAIYAQPVAYPAATYYTPAPAFYTPTGFRSMPARGFFGGGFRGRAACGPSGCS